MKIKVTKWNLVFCIIILFFFFLSAFLFLRLRGGVTVSPNENITVTEKIVFYRQDNPSWAEDKLGSSEYTMESSGCIITCIASALTMSGQEITPGELNLSYADKIFDNQGNILWENLRKHGGYDVQVYSETSDDMLMECLKNGIFPIVRVRMNGVGNFHYVLVVKAENDIFFCMDPLEDELIPLSQYGNRIYAIRSVAP